MDFYLPLLATARAESCHQVLQDPEAWRGRIGPWIIVGYYVEGWDSVLPFLDLLG